MKILLAPAETKNEGGDCSPFCKDNFFLEELFDKRTFIFEEYEKYIKSLDIEELSKWFGLKKLEDVKKYQMSLKDKPTMKAIQRYNGVAFDAIEYSKLENSEQKYIDDNVILFSNLFGPIKADDLIPDYKYKQGAKLPVINVEKYYKDNFTNALDDFLGEEIIDLRAGFYEKFYSPKSSKVITMKFIKDGKVVSHWAKHYRGIVLNSMTKNNIKSIDELMNMQISDLSIFEIKKQKNKTELVYDILT